MSKSFYPKLAWSNLGKNRRIYFPYIAACTITAAMLYMMASLASNAGLENLPTGTDLTQSILGFGVWVCIIFIAIFLFYTNSFLIKNRQKEFGLYNILGMEKRHIARVIGFEMLYTAGISAALGIVLGVLFDKLAFMLLLKMCSADIPLGFSFSVQGALYVAGLYAAVFLLIFFKSVSKVHFSKPIELLRGGRAGEREPKSKWIMAVLGVACIGAGYFISVTTLNPTKAAARFFIAVILVIIGTYFLFIAASVVFLKLLRKNKAYYYKLRHFISVSGMLYRMKQNAVGLASICILSTMVIVTISSTLSLWAGLNDMIYERYPSDYMISCSTEIECPEILEGTAAFVEKSLTECGIKSSNEALYRYARYTAALKDDIISTERRSADELTSTCRVEFIPLEDYNRCMGMSKALSDGEILLYVYRSSYSYDDITIDGTKYHIAEKLTDYMKNGEHAALVFPSFCVVLPTMAQVSAAGLSGDVGCCCSFDLAAQNGAKPDYSAQEQLKIRLNENMTDFLSKNSDGESYSYSIEWRAEVESEFRELYAGLFFIGVFLGLLFSVAAVLIIYYKQISEGYDDRERFVIMQRVGLSHEEVRRAIRSQVLTVFFLPLVTAGIHMAFAFPAIYRILTLLSLTNINLYVICTLAVFGAFALLYTVVYLITAQSYYRIVSE